MCVCVSEVVLLFVCSAVRRKVNPAVDLLIAGLQEGHKSNAHSLGSCYQLYEGCSVRWLNIDPIWSMVNQMCIY